MKTKPLQEEEQQQEKMKIKTHIQKLGLNIH